MQRHRRLIFEALVEHLLHQPLQAGEAELGAGLTEGDEEAGAGALQPEAAMNVRMSL